MSSTLKVKKYKKYPPNLYIRNLILKELNSIRREREPKTFKIKLFYSPNANENDN